MEKPVNHVTVINKNANDGNKQHCATVLLFDRVSRD